MLINCTNHPYEIWSEEEKTAAKQYGEVRSIPFPHIEPQWTPKDIKKIAIDYAKRIESMNPDAVLITGEFTFAFMLIDRLLRDGFKVICSCSKRISAEVKKEDGSSEKKSVFLFEGFREYTRC